MAESIDLGPIDLADVIALDEALARTTAAEGFGVTDGGFVPKPFARLLSEKLALARSLLGADLDLTAGSVIRKLLELSALEDARTWAALARIYDDQYVASAAGSALSRLGEELGVVRPFLEATGTVTLTFAPPTGRNSLTLPRGARLLTSGDHHVATAAPLTLTRDRPTRSVEVVAFYPGPDHNLDPAQPDQRVTRWNGDDRKLEWDGALPGLTQLARDGHVAPETIVAIVHGAPLTGGEQGWPDARYRKLLLRAPRALWSADGIRLAASLVPGVRQAQVIDDLGGLDVDHAVFGQFRFGEALFAAGRDLVAPHSVDVLVAPRPAAITGEGPGNLRADVAAAIEHLRPLGIGIRVVEADQVFVGVEATVAVEGLPIPRSPSAQLTSPVANELKQRLLLRVADYVEGLPFGEPVRYAEVMFALMSEPGVSDVTELRLLRFPPLNPQAADPAHGYQRMELGTNVQIGATQITVPVNDDRWIKLGMTVGADVFHSDALGNMAAHLSGPLVAGARQTPIVLDAGGVGAVREATRYPLLLVVLKIDLDASARQVDVVIGGAAAVRLSFAPYSERGASLGLAFAPLAPPIAISVSPHADVELRLVDGVLGRLLFALSAEKARLRRAAREIAATRRLAGARGEGLDRLGAELRVPRFRAELAWSAAAGEIVATPGDEADAPYRKRLALYRGQVRPTRSELGAVLPRLMGQVGYTGAFTLDEPDTELAIAIRVVSPPDDARRLAHLAYLRRQFLLAVDATELPAERLVSVAERTRARELLARLHTETSWPAGAHVAPAIATALDRVARCAAALGASGPLQVTGAQRDDGGSRYELGVGADVKAFAGNVVQAMADALRARTFSGDPDAETRLLLARMTPADADDDASARWLFAGCGLRTVHSLGGGTLLVSHLPMHGATLDVASTGSGLDLHAMLRAEGAGTLDANLASTLASAIDDPSAWLVAPPTVLSAVSPPPAAAAALFSAERLVTPSTAPALVTLLTALGALPAELFAVLRADAAISANILAGNGAGGAALHAVVGRLRASGAVSILPLVAGSSVFLVVGMTDLPGNAAVFNRRRAQFRWFAAPVEADARIGTLELPRGARNRYAFGGSGSASQVAAIIALTPTRPAPHDLHRRVDPYTVAVDLADAGQPLLSFAQYEYLMNLLERWCPLGVTIDTSRLRAQRVDFDGDGVADLMSLRLSHTFRPFRGRRPLGARS